MVPFVCLMTFILLGGIPVNSTDEMDPHHFCFFVDILIIDGFVTLVGMEDVTRLPALTARLLACGYEAMAVRKILGGNLLRVFRQVVG